jgi:serine/threonine-protein kinase
MSSSTEHVGRVVGGRYRLLTPIGSGASSQVFAAVDSRLGRRVAVKVLHPTLAGDGSFLARFRAEARLAASLDHHNVMRVFDWGEDDSGAYLVLELLPGGSLRALLDRSGPLSHAQVARIGAEAAAGLAFAHRRGIVHRDVKPGNILFDGEGHLRIGDFGVARVLGGGPEADPSGLVFGTARYASPEQAMGAALDDRTDVYSLALVLYEALTGRVPFAGDSVQATLQGRIGVTLPPAPELGPLAPILAEATIPEAFARLDAAGLQSELETLARQLPAPEPLRLVRIELGGTVAELADRDLTQLEPGHPSYRETVAFPTIDRPATEPLPTSPPPQAGASSQAGPEVQAGPDLQAGPVSQAGPELQAGPDVRAAPSARRARRWSRRRVLVLSLAAVLLLGGTAGAIAISVVHGIYAHVVPNLVGEDLVTAREQMAGQGLQLRQLPPSYNPTVAVGRIIKQSQLAGHHDRAGAVVYVTVSLGPQPVPVPGVTGAGQSAASQTITAAHLVPVIQLAYSDVVGRGKVISQFPTSSGPPQPPGSKVYLRVSRGPQPRPVPTVTGLPLQGAESALHAAQLRWHIEPPGQYSTTVPEGDVISESPPKGTVVGRWTAVNLVVSLGMPYVTVPPVRGLAVKTAEARLTAAGLHWSVYGPSFGHTVLYSTPRQGQQARMGATVTLYVG